VLKDVQHLRGEQQVAEWMGAACPAAMPRGPELDWPRITPSTLTQRRKWAEEVVHVSRFQSC